MDWFFFFKYGIIFSCRSTWIGLSLYLFVHFLSFFLYPPPPNIYAHRNLLWYWNFTWMIYKSLNQRIFCCTAANSLSFIDTRCMYYFLFLMFIMYSLCNKMRSSKDFILFLNVLFLPKIIKSYVAFSVCLNLLQIVRVVPHCIGL